MALIETLAPIFEPLLGDGVRPEDADWATEHARTALAAIAGPELEVAMIGPDPEFRQDFAGIDGFFEGWTDWLSPFESFRLQLDDVIEGEDQIVTLVRQFATPTGGSVELENVGAAVWRFRGDRLVRVEFHLDRALGLTAAGVEPTPELLGRNAQSSQE